MKKSVHVNNDQSGLALISVLLLMIPITLVAVMSLRMNVADESMVAASYTKEQARLGAEAALQYAEKELRLNPTLYFTAFSILQEEEVVFDNNFEGDNLGDDCWQGLCLPLNVTDWDTSVELDSRKRGGQWVVSNANDVWSDPDRYRVVPESVATGLALDISPKYIVEFMGHIPRVRDDGRLYDSLCDKDGDGFSGPGEAKWDQFPYCRQDPIMFRITSLGEAGLGGRSRVVLQSTYIIDANSV